jgi:hypothetical protein
MEKRGDSLMGTRKGEKWEIESMRTKEWKRPEKLI